MFVTDNMSKFARSSKNCEKLEKSQFLLKLLNSSGKGCRRVSSENCNFSKNCEKLEKSQVLLKLIKSSVRGGARVPGKNCDFCNFCNFSKNCKNHNQLCLSFSFTKLLSKPTTILELVKEIR